MALELAVIDQRQAEVTKALAEATALVIREVRDIPGPCCMTPVCQRGERNARAVKQRTAFEIKRPHYPPALETRIQPAIHSKRCANLLDRPAAR